MLFFSSSFPNFPNVAATEGPDTPFSFMVTPNEALTAEYRVRWEIILDGQLPAGFNAFDTRSGVITFTTGATVGEMITLPIINDAARADVKTFSVRLTQIDAGDQEVQIGTDQAISLTDNDIGEFAHISLSSTGEHDTLVAGSSYTYRSFTGVGGNDTMVITRFQTGDITINDVNGQNIIKLDHGVQITDVDRDIFVIPNGGMTIVNSITITLATGSEITITSPDSGLVGSKRYSYQIGDGALTDYAGFYAAITNGGFKEGDSGPLGKTFVVAYPVAGASTASTDTSTEILFTATLVDAATEDEDTPYEFTITPNAALTAGYRVRWEIILDGQLPAGFNDFDALSGVVTFANGATSGETVTLPIIDDAARGDVKSFSVRLTQIDADDEEVQIGTDQAISLTDNDIGEFAHISLSSTGEHDTLVAGSSYTYRSFTGVGGNDTMIITRFQTGDITINDVNGQNIIKLDHGVQITDVDRDIFVIPNGGMTIVNSITITLATGSEITITSPDSGLVGSKRYSYQIGDGALTDYAGFYAAITNGGFKEGDTGPLGKTFVVAYPNSANVTVTLDVDTGTLEETDSAEAALLATATLEGDDLDDYTAFSTSDSRFTFDGTSLSIASGAAFDFEAGETIVVTVTATKDGGVLPISDIFTLTLTSVNDAPPVFTDNPTAVLEGVEIAANAEVYTAFATGDAGAAVTYSLASGRGDDAALFNIDANTGDVRIITATTPDYETDQDGYSFTVIATATGGYIAEHAVTIAITPVDEHAPIIGGVLTGAASPTSVTATGILTVDGDLDADSGASADLGHHTTVVTPPSELIGTYGTLSFEGNTWTYTIDATRDATRRLNDGETAMDSFDVTAGTATDTIVITVTGANDASTVVITTNAGTVAESADGATVDSIRFTASDVDSDDQNYAASGFTILSSDTAAISHAAVQGLFEVYLVEGVDGAADAVFGVKVQDGQSLDFEDVSSYGLKFTYADSAESDAVTITVTNLDEAPTFAAATATASVNDGTETLATTIIYTATATPAVSDQVIAYSLEGTDSSLFSIDETSGAVTFAETTTPDSDAGAYTDGYSFTVVATAGGGAARQDVTIAVNPIDEHAPDLIGEVTGTVVAQADVNTDTGRLRLRQDADSFAAHQTSSIDQTDSIVGIYGTLSFVENTWTYTLDNDDADTLALDDGAIGTDVFTITAGAHLSQEITVTVTGANDVPTIVFSNDGYEGVVFENERGASLGVAGVFFKPFDPDPSDQNYDLTKLTIFSANTDVISDEAIRDLFEVRINDVGNGFAGLRIKEGQFVDYEDVAQYAITVTYGDGASTSARSEVITIDVINEDDRPVFTSLRPNAIVENAEIPATQIIHTLTARPGGPSSEVITYSIRNFNQGIDSGLFNIDENTGVITFKTTTRVTSAERRGTYGFEAVATADDGQFSTQGVQISVRNINEAPSLELSIQNLLPDVTTFSVMVVNEPDYSAYVPTYTVALVTADDEADSADNHLFSIDANTGQITLTGAAKNGGEVYRINIEVTDTTRIAGGPPETVTATQAFTFVQEGVYLSIDGTRHYTASDVGVIDENTDGTTPVNIGVLALIGSTGVFTLAEAPEDGVNDNAEFDILIDGSTYILRYIGSNSGDYDGAAPASKVIHVAVDGTTYAYTVLVSNINEDVRITSDAAVMVDEALHFAADAPFYQVIVDKDHVDAVITYAISGGDSALFDIDANGAVTFKVGTTPDFETKSSYSFTVGVESAHASGNAAATQAVTITVTDVNEAPTLTLSDDVLLPGATVIDIIAADPDAASGNYSYAFSVAGGVEASADNHLFNIDSTTGQLTLIGAEKASGESYRVSVLVTDTTDGVEATRFHDFTIIQGGVFLTSDLNYYSNDDRGVIDENADGSGTRIEVGLLSLSGRDDGPIFTLAPAGAGNDNAEFEVANSVGPAYSLYYTGSDFGDYEGVDGRPSKTVEFIVEGVSSFYTILARDVDDNAPVFGGDITGTISEDDYVGAGSAGFSISGAVVVTDADATAALQTTEVEAPSTTPISGTYGVLAVNTDGTWTYQVFIGESVRAPIKALGVGETLTDTFANAFTATDTNGVDVTQDITVTITGTNDRPVVTMTGTATSNEGVTTTRITEDNTQGLLTAVSFTAADIDATDSAAINAGVANFVVRDENGGISTMFEVYARLPGSAGVDTTFALRLIPGQSFDHETTARYVLTIEYDDQSGADNAVSALHTVTINVNDINEAEDIVFSSAATGTALIDAVVITVEPVYTAIAANADFPGVVTYGISGADSGLFDIDESTGDVTFTESTTIDFETKSSYSFTVRAATYDNDNDRQVANFQEVTIAVTDVNEAPTGLVLSRSVLVPGSITVGTVITEDPDTAGGTYSYAITGGADAALFSLTAEGVLTFANTAGTNAGANDRKAFGGTYDIEITVMDTHTDGTTLSYAESFTILEGGVVLVDSSVIAPVARYSGHAAGEIAENADGSETAIYIGVLSIAGGVSFPAFTFVEAPEGTTNDNAEFEIRLSSLSDLYYIGSNSGDFESPTQGAKTIHIETGGVIYAFTILVSDVNEAPVLTLARPTLLDDATTLDIITTDADTAEATYAYAFSTTGNAEDNGLFSIDATTGQLTLTGTRKAYGEYYAINVEVSDISGGVTVTTTQEFFFAQGGVNIVNTAVPGDITLSGDERGLIDENADGSTASIEIGVFQRAGQIALSAFTLAPAGAGNDNAEFEFVQMNDGPFTLFYIGTDAGDYDGAERGSKTVQLMLDGHTYDYVILLSDVNEDVSITSAATAALVEGTEVAADTIVYQAAATKDHADATLFYQISGDDSDLFNIDSATGAVTFKTATNPDFETKESYSFAIDVVSTHTSGNHTDTQAVTITVTDINDFVTITRSRVLQPLVEGQVYTGEDETPLYGISSQRDFARATRSHTLTGEDADLFYINAGSIRFKETTTPDFETKPSYSLTVEITSTHASGVATTSQDITLMVTDVNEAPTLTLLAPALSLTGTTIDIVPIDLDAASSAYTYAFATTGDAADYADNGLFEINADTGQLTRTGTIKESGEVYHITVEVTDTSGRDVVTATQALTIIQGGVLLSHAGFNYFNNDDRGVIDENADGSGTRIEVGILGITGRDDGPIFTLAPTGAGNDNDEFEVSISVGSAYSLYYTGSDFGDYEGDGGRPSKTVELMVDDTSYFYTVLARDVNDFVTITSAATGAVLVENTEVAADAPLYTTVVDKDFADAVITYTLEGGDSDLFEIDDDGVVTFVEAITPNFEAKSSYSFTVVATSTHASGTVAARQEVTLAVTDVNEVPTIRLAAPVIEIGQTELAIITTDIDAASGDYSYALTTTDKAAESADNDLFRIDAATGMLTRTGAAKDSGRFYNIAVEVTDTTGGVEVTAIQTFTFVQGGVFFTSGGHKIYSHNPDGYPGFHEESKLSGIHFGQLGIAGSNARTTYFMVTEPGFSLATHSAKAFLSLSPDRVTGDHDTGNGGVIQLTFLIDLDGFGGSAHEEIIHDYFITLIDRNDFVTVAENDLGMGFVENTEVAAGTEVYTATAEKDFADAVVTYAISGTHADLFNIDATTGVVTVKADLTPDFETASSYSVVVTATSTHATGTATATTNLVFEVTDINEAPTLTIADTTIAHGATVIDIISADADADAADSTYVYAFSTAGDAADSADNGLFTINAETGQLTLSGTAKASGEVYNIVVEVTETSGEAEITATQAFTILQGGLYVDVSVRGGFENEGSDDYYSNDDRGLINENTVIAPGNSLIIGELKFTGAPDAAFTLDVGNDVVIFSNNNLGYGGDGSLDHDAGDTETISINVFLDGDKTGTPDYVIDYVVNLIDLNDLVAFTSATTATALVEGAEIAAGTTIYTAAVEMDVTDAVVTYAIKDGGDSDLFTIDVNTGVVTAKADFTPDFEAQDSYSITIYAISTHATGTASGVRVVSIAVTDVNEAPTLALATPALAYGATVIDIIATDADADKADSTYAYAFVTTGDAADYADNGLFSIDAVTGQLTLTGTAKASGESYNIAVEVTDTSGEAVVTATQALTLLQGGLYLTSNINGTGEKLYSNTPDGQPNLPEETLFSGTFGRLGIEGATLGVTTYTLGDDAISAMFRIIPGGAEFGEASFLAFPSNNRMLGDHEAADGDALTVNILVDLDGAGGADAVSHEYIVTLSDVNEAVVATSAATGTALVEGVEISADTIVYQITVDKDHKDAVVTYVIGNDGGLFTIDENGAVRFREATTPDFEANPDGYSFDIGVVSAHPSSPSGSVRGFHAVTIAITDVNEAPTLALSSPVLEIGATVIDITATDADAGATDSVYTYAFATTGDAADYADNGLFSINAETGQLALTGTAKASGAFYHIAVEVTDTANGAAVTATQAFTITQGGLYIAPESNIDTVVTRIYSNDPDGNRWALEEATGLRNLGYFDIEGATLGVTTYTLENSADSASFRIEEQSGIHFLIFDGGALGDHEAVDGGALTLNIMVDLDGTGTEHTAVLHEYVVTLSDVNEVVTDASSIVGRYFVENVEYAAGTEVHRAIPVADHKDAVITYQFAAAHDNRFFNIDENTGVITLKNDLTPDYEEGLGRSYIIGYIIESTHSSGTVTTLTGVTFDVINVNDQPVVESADSSSHFVIAAGTSGGTELSAIVFNFLEFDAGQAVSANDDRSVKGATVMEDGAISELFETYVDNVGRSILRIKEGQTVGADLGGDTPEHTLVINYDDGSGEDNAISEDLIITIDII